MPQNLSANVWSNLQQTFFLTLEYAKKSYPHIRVIYTYQVPKLLTLEFNSQPRNLKSLKDSYKLQVFL